MPDESQRGRPEAAARLSGLLDAGALDEAAGLCAWALEAEPLDGRVWTLVAVVRLLTGDAVGGAEALAQALRLDPADAEARAHLGPVKAMVQNAYREAIAAAQTGDEGAGLEAAYRALGAAQDLDAIAPADVGGAHSLFLRMAAYERAERLGSIAEIGEVLAAQDDGRGLLGLLPRAEGEAGRAAVLAAHRAWGRRREAEAREHPRAPPSRPARERLRVAILSSDLRRHAVAPFIEPLLQSEARDRFELVGVSAQPGEGDEVQSAFRAALDGFVHTPGARTAEVAETVARMAPDVLLEIGGCTNHNLGRVLAYRLAPLQVSWMGYPHSLGLDPIDGMILDPHLAPTREGAILESPLLMPASWIAFSPTYFDPAAPMRAEPPSDRSGRITFGAAGSPYKYSRATLHAWARCLSAVPDSRFLFIRPEGSSPTFRRNVGQAFADAGVDPERLDFAPVRAGYLAHYDRVDVSLDTFPLTGGMTTCEALWMGLPVVSLRGPAVHERISHSILTNAGLGDLSVESVDAFVETAVRIAGDVPRRRAWRGEARRRISASPLGDTSAFGRDFFDLLERAARART